MIRSVQKKTSPKVIGGKVQKKNNWAETPNYYNDAPPSLVIDRKRPGIGYRHLLKQRDIVDFIAILPDWAELSRGLNGIVLAPGDWRIFGYHRPGVIHICAWDKDLWITLSKEGVEQERFFLERFGVDCEPNGDDVLCKFSEATARAHQLLATLLHELGHHHDRMTTRSKGCASRGEGYAEEYAKRYTDQIWARYLDTFGML
ncbi:MAG TPA: hypothetical protein VI837_14260 [Blastocatellia bacterium]|nr:hypothetical protein [Blastocatellia bacterium]